MEENTYCVYMHILKTDGRKYIGITCQEPKIRWGKNGNGYRKNKYFCNAIKKYGWNNFKHEILFENLSEEQACLKEKALIKLFDTTRHNFGFNLTTGGETHYNLTTEIKEKLSQNCTKWFIDKNELYDLYIVQNKSMSEIAKILNIPLTAVKSRIYKIGFRKTKTQRAQVMTKNNKKYNIDFGKLQEMLLVDNKSYSECAEYFNCSVGIIKVYASTHNFKKTKEQVIQVVNRRQRQAREQN